MSSTIAPDQHGNLSEFRQHRNLEESSKKITETTWFWSYIGSLLGGIVLIFILFLLTIYCGCMRKSRPMRRISRQSDLQKVKKKVNLNSSFVPNFDHCPNSSRTNLVLKHRIFRSWIWLDLIQSNPSNYFWQDLYRRRRSIWNQRQSTEIPTPRFCSTPIHGAPNDNDRIPLRRLFMRGKSNWGSSSPGRLLGCIFFVRM